jgi:hypothetical protein
MLQCSRQRTHADIVNYFEKAVRMTSVIEVVQETMPASAAVQCA